MAKKLADEVEIVIIGDGEDIYIVVDGVKIAILAPEAKRFLSIEPG